MAVDIPWDIVGSIAQLVSAIATIAIAVIAFLQIRGISFERKRKVVLDLVAVLSCIATYIFNQYRSEQVVKPRVKIHPFAQGVTIDLCVDLEKYRVIGTRYDIKKFLEALYTKVKVFKRIVKGYRKRLSRIELFLENEIKFMGKNPVYAESISSEIYLIIDKLIEEYEMTSKEIIKSCRGIAKADIEGELVF